MIKLSDINKDKIVFGMRVLSAEYEDFGTWGVVTRVYHGYNDEVWIGIHWNNGNHSWFRHNQYNAVDVI